MKKEYANLEELILKNLNTNEDLKTTNLIHKLRNVAKQGYFTKEEFYSMCMWKTQRQKPRYLSNSEEDIRLVSRDVFSTGDEEKKIELLISLHGVGIPVASAILMLTKPQDYAVIDKRVWQILYLYGEVNTKQGGTNFRVGDWNTYLLKLRGYAGKFEVTARNIDLTLYFYHKKIQEGTLYRSENPNSCGNSKCHKKCE